MTYASQIINLLLVLAFIADRTFRLKYIKEYKDARAAQIDSLKQQLENERGNNDIRLTAMHKQRYESLKLILDEKALEIDHYKTTLSEWQEPMQDNAEKTKLIELLVTEINRLERTKHTLEIEKKALLQSWTNNQLSKNRGGFNCI